MSTFFLLTFNSQAAKVKSPEAEEKASQPADVAPTTAAEEEKDLTPVDKVTKVKNDVEVKEKEEDEVKEAKEVKGTKEDDEDGREGECGEEAIPLVRAEDGSYQTSFVIYIRDARWGLLLLHLSTTVL